MDSGAETDGPAEMRVAFPEPAVGVFNASQNAAAVRFGSSRVRGRGLGKTGCGHGGG